jgi:hypothetical protein
MSLPSLKYEHLEGAAKEIEMHRLKMAKEERVSDVDHPDFNRYYLIRTMRTSLPPMTERLDESFSGWNLFFIFRTTRSPAV